MGRVATLLSHYWTDDDPVELMAAIGKDWADLLEGFPQSVIQSACLQFMREEPRKKPTPAAIYAMARALMPLPKAVPSPSEDAAREPRVSGARALEILAELNFRPRTFGGSSAD